VLPNVPFSDYDACYHYYIDRDDDGNDDNATIDDDGDDGDNGGDGAASPSSPKARDGSSGGGDGGGDSDGGDGVTDSRRSGVSALRRLLISLVDPALFMQSGVSVTLAGYFSIDAVGSGGDDKSGATAASGDGDGEGPTASSALLPLHQLLYRVVLSNTTALLYTAYALALLATPSMLALLIPFVIVVFAIPFTPRPPKLFWSFCIWFTVG